jgi:hypothetical protein
MRRSETTLPDALRQFTFNGAATLEKNEARIAYFLNEYWTVPQRQDHVCLEITLYIPGASCTVTSGNRE